MIYDSEARSIAQGKLSALIDTGRDKAASVIQHVFQTQPSDKIARGTALGFRADEGRVLVEPSGDGEGYTVHSNALGQLSERADIPQRYATELVSRGGWGAELLAHNLTQIYGHGDPKTRYLLRTVGGQLRGFLSDRYRRLDSRPIVESFAAACAELGALPYDGHAYDTQIAIQAIMPVLYEPIPNEVLAVGCSLRNSDFGKGPLELRAFFLRLTCKNGAIGKDDMRHVHLGGRLADNIAFSQRTYELDTQTMSSAIGDVMRGSLSAASIAATLEQIKASHERKLAPAEIEAKLKGKLSKSEAKEVVEAFTSADVDMMPAGQTAWRLSNALSWVAQKKEGDAKLDYMRLAGEIVQPD